MHIPDGILPPVLTIAGFAGAAAIVALALRRIERRPDARAGIPRAAMMTAVFFVATLVHFPIPPASVHLTLCGLMGVMLGWYAVPAILIGLFLQAVMFGHGGITTLGVNAVIFTLPALSAFALSRLFSGARSRAARGLLAFGAGAGAVLIGTALFVAFLIAGLPAHLDPVAERAAIAALALAHLPLALVEGLVVAAVIGFLHRVSPDLLRAA